MGKKSLDARTDFGYTFSCPASVHVNRTCSEELKTGSLDLLPIQLTPPFGAAFFCSEVIGRMHAPRREIKRNYAHQLTNTPDAKATGGNERRGCRTFAHLSSIVSRQTTDDALRRFSQPV